MKHVAFDLSSFGGILFRIGCVIALVLGLMYGTLKLVERSKDPLRQGIEQYLAETTNMFVSIDSLNEVTFFPRIRFDLRNIMMRQNTDQDTLQVKIESLDIAMPFWQLVWGQSAFEALSLKNIFIKKDIWFPYDLVLTHVQVEHDLKTERPVLRAEGAYGGKSASFYLELESKPKSEESFLYYIRTGKPLSLTLGDKVLSGLYNIHDQKIMLSQATLSGNGKTYGPADVVFKQPGRDQTDVLSCLLNQSPVLSLKDTHPCVHFFKPETEVQTP
ncbi:MAG: hypothetical protein J0L77_02320 [Alphaproteobacteria bacterium]|nr:hypothetical protein [Alphaproteobacteria bacterium]